MSFNLLIQKAAKGALGAFVEEDSLNSLTITGLGVSDIVVTLRDLRLRAETLQDLTGLRFLCGTIRLIKLTITGGLWGLTTGQPIRLEVDGVYVLLGSMPQPKQDEAARCAAAEQAQRSLRYLLELDRKLYEQKLMPLLYTALGLEDPGAKAGGGSGGIVERITDGVIGGGVIELTNLHIRYEDTQLGAKPFAVGVTLQRFFTTKADPARPAEGVPKLGGGALHPVPGLQYRDASLSAFALYWDPLAPAEAMAALVPAPGAAAAAPDAWRGLHAAMAAGIEAKGAAASRHKFVLLPISPAVALALNLKNKPGQPFLNASLSVELALGVTPRQMAAGKALGAFMGAKSAVVETLQAFPPPAWSALEALKALSGTCRAAGGSAPRARVLYVSLEGGQDEGAGAGASREAPLRTIAAALRVAKGAPFALTLLPPAALPAALPGKPRLQRVRALLLGRSREGRMLVLKVLFALLVGRRLERERVSGATGDLGSCPPWKRAAFMQLYKWCARPGGRPERRWDLDRMRGAGDLRRRYQPAYASVLNVQKEALVCELTKAKPALKLDAAAVAAVEAMDDGMPTWQAVTLRELGRMAMEETLGTLKKKTTFFEGLWGAKPKPAAPGSPSGGGGGDSASPRVARGEDEGQPQVKDFMHFSLVIPSTSKFTLFKEGAAPVPILEVALGGKANYTSTTGSPWNAQLDITKFDLRDCVTRNTAFPLFIQPLREAEADEAALDARGLLAASGGGGGSPLALAAPPPRAAPPKSLSFLRLNIDSSPVNKPGIDLDVNLVLNPLRVVFAPECVIALAHFSGPVAEDASAGAAAAGKSAANDAYSALASKQKMHLMVEVAAPVLVLPADICDRLSPRLRVSLGVLRLLSSSYEQELKGGAEWDDSAVYSRSAAFTGPSLPDSDNEEEEEPPAELFDAASRANSDTPERRKRVERVLVDDGGGSRWANYYRTSRLELNEMSADLVLRRGPGLRATTHPILSGSNAGPRVCGVNVNLSLQDYNLEPMQLRMVGELLALRVNIPFSLVKHLKVLMAQGEGFTKGLATLPASDEEFKDLQLADDAAKAAEKAAAAATAAAAAAAPAAAAAAAPAAGASTQVVVAEPQPPGAASPSARSKEAGSEAPAAMPRFGDESIVASFKIGEVALSVCDVRKCATRMLRVNSAKKSPGGTAAAAAEADGSAADDADAPTSDLRIVLSDLSLEARQRAGDGALQLQAHLHGLEVEDLYAVATHRAGGGSGACAYLSHFVSSTFVPTMVAAHSGAARLEDAASSQHLIDFSLSVVGGATRVGVAMTHLHVGYNPGTVSGLMLYGDYLGHIFSEGKAAAAAPAAAPSSLAIEDAAAAPGAAAGAAAAPPAAAAPSAGVALAIAGGADPMEVVLTGQGAATLAREPHAAASVTMTIVAELTSLTLAFNVERRDRPVAELAIRDLKFGQRASATEGSVMHVTLTDIRLLDSSRGPSTLHPVLLSKATEEGTLLEFRMAAYPPLPPPTPGTPPSTRLDSEIKVLMAPLKYTHINSTLTGVLDYLQAGILGSLVSSAASAAGEAAASAAKSAARTGLNVTLRDLLVTVPRDAASTQCLALRVGELRVNNRFFVQGAFAGSGPCAIDAMKVSLASLTVSAMDAAGGTELVLQPLLGFEVALNRELDVAEGALTDIAVTLPAPTIKVSRRTAVAALEMLACNIQVAAESAAKELAAGGISEEELGGPPSSPLPALPASDATALAAAGAAAAGTAAAAAPAPSDPAKGGANLSVTLAVPGVLTLAVLTEAPDTPFSAVMGASSDAALLELTIDGIKAGFSSAANGSTKASFALSNLLFKAYETPSSATGPCLFLLAGITNGLDLQAATTPDGLLDVSLELSLDVCAQEGGPSAAPSAPSGQLLLGNGSAGAGAGSSASAAAERAAALLTPIIAQPWRVKTVVHQFALAGAFPSMDFGEDAAPAPAAPKLPACMDVQVTADHPLLLSVSDALLRKVQKDIGVFTKSLNAMLDSIKQAQAAGGEQQQQQQQQQPAKSVKEELVPVAVQPGGLVLSLPAEDVPYLVAPSMSISVRLPLILVDLTEGFVGQRGHSGSGRLLIRAALAGLDFSMCSAALYEPGAEASGASLSSMVILLNGLHVADADPSLDALRHVSLLVTTAPDSQALACASALHPTLDLSALSAIDAVGGAVDTALLSVSGKGMRARATPALCVSAALQRRDGHVPLSTRATAQAKNLPRTLSQTIVRMGSQVTICWNARTVVSVMEWIGKATDTGEQPPVPAAAGALPAGAAEAAAAAAAAPPPPPPPPPPATDGSSLLEVHARGLRLRMAKFALINSVNTYRPVALLSLGGLDVVLASSSAAGMDVKVSLSTVELLDCTTEGNLHPAILGRRHPLSPLEDPATAPTLVTVHFAAPPNAPTALVVDVQPMKITFIMLPFMEFLDYLFKSVLDSLTGGGSVPEPMKDEVRYAVTFPRADDAAERKKFGTMLVTVAAETSIFVPQSPRHAAGIQLELALPLTVSNALVDRDFSRRTEGEKGSEWEWGGKGKDKCCAAASVLTVAIQGTRLLAIPSHADIIPRLALDLSLVSFTHAGAALRVGGLTDIAIAPITADLTPTSYGAIMAVLADNISAPSPLVNADKQECLLEESSIDAPPVAFRPAAVECRVTRAKFGAVRPRHHCLRCGATVCLAAIAGKVWDNQEAKAKVVCKPCLKALRKPGSAEDPLHSHLTEAAAPAGGAAAAATAAATTASAAGAAAAAPAAAAVAAAPSDKAPSTLAIHLPSVKASLLLEGLRGAPPKALAALELAGAYIEITSCPDSPEGAEVQNGGSELLVEIMALRVSDERIGRDRGSFKGPRGFLSPRLANLGLAEDKWRMPRALRPTRKDLNPHLKVRISTVTGGGSFRMIEPADEYIISKIISVYLFETNLCPDLKLLTQLGEWFSAKPAAPDAAAAPAALPSSPPAQQPPAAKAEVVVGSDGTISFRNASPVSDTAIMVSLTDVRAIIVGDLKAVLEKSAGGAAGGGAQQQPPSEDESSELSAIIATLNLRASILMQTQEVASMVLSNVRPATDAQGVAAYMARARVQRNTSRIDARAIDWRVGLGRLTAGGTLAAGREGGASLKGGLLPILSAFVPSIQGPAAAAAAAASPYPADLIPLLSRLDCTWDLGEDNALLPSLSFLVAYNTTHTQLISLDPRTLIDPTGSEVLQGAAAKKPILAQLCLAAGPLPCERKLVKARIEPVQVRLLTDQIDLVTAILGAWQGSEEGEGAASPPASPPTPTASEGSGGGGASSALSTGGSGGSPASPGASDELAPSAASLQAVSHQVSVPGSWHEHDYEVVLPEGAFQEALGKYLPLALENLQVDPDPKALPLLRLSRPSTLLAPPLASDRGPAFTYDNGSGAVSTEDVSAMAAAFSLGLFQAGDVLVAVNGTDPTEWSRAYLAEGVGVREAVARRIAAENSPRVELRFRGLPLGLDVLVSSVSIELQASLPGRTMPLVRAALSGVVLDLQGHPTFGFSSAAELRVEDLQREAAKKGLLGLTSGTLSSQLATALQPALHRSRHDLLSAREALLSACVQRPARSSIVGRAALQLQVSTYHQEGRSWEPLLEPFAIKASGSMLDSGRSAEPTQTVLVELDPLRATASPSMLKSIELLVKALSANSTSQRVSRALSSAGFKGGEIPAGELRLTSLPASGFSYVLRNETGVPLLLSIKGREAPDGKPASDVLIGCGVSAVSLSPALLGGSGSAPLLDPRAAPVNMDAYLEAARDAQARGCLPLPFALPSGCEVGFTTGTAPSANSVLVVQACVLPPASQALAAPGKRWVERLYLSQRPQHSQAYHGLSLPPQTPGASEARSGLVCVNLTSTQRPAQLMTTLRSAALVVNRCDLPLSAWAAVPAPAAGRATPELHTLVPLGIVAPGARVPVPLTLAAFAVLLRSLAHARPAEAFADKAAVLAAGGIPLHADHSSGESCFRSDAAAAPFFLSYKVLHLHKVEAEGGSSRFGPSAAPTLHATCSALVVSPPVTLTNALPVPARYRVASFPSAASAPDAASPVQAIAEGELAPSASTHVYGASAGCAALWNAEQRLMPHLSLRPEGQEWTPWTPCVTIRASKLREGGEVHVKCAQRQPAAPPPPAPWLPFALPWELTLTTAVTAPRLTGALSASAADAAAGLAEDNDDDELTAEGTHLHSLGRLHASWCVETWFINCTGLPLTVGHLPAEKALPLAAFSWGAEATPSVAAAVTAAAAPAAAAAPDAAAPVPSALAFTPPVVEEVHEYERKHLAMAWGDPLPTDLKNKGRWSKPKAEVDASLPAGWVWCGDWVADPWDHASKFSSFNVASRGVKCPEYRLGKDCRCRRWFRVRRTEASLAAGVGGGSVSASGASSPPGLRWVSKPGPDDSSAGAAAAAGAAMWLGAGQPLWAPPGSAAAAAAAPFSAAAFNPNAIGGNPIAYLRVGAGGWSSPIVTDVPASGAQAPVSMRLKGEAGSGNWSGSTRDADCKAACAGYDVTVHVERCPAPFARSRRVIVVPRHTLVNATGRDLWWRQAGGASAASPLPSPPVCLGPYASTPLWFSSAERAAVGLNLVQLCPSSSKGGWSPPVPPFLPEVDAGGGSAPSTLAFSLAVPVKSAPSPSQSQSTTAGAFVETVAGAACMGFTTLGVRLRAAETGGGSTVMVVTQESHPKHPVRPPTHYATGARLAELKHQTEVDKVSRRFSTATGLSLAADGAALATPEKQRPALALAAGATPAPPSSPPLSPSALQPAGAAPQLLTRPLMSFTNHSRYPLVVSQKGGHSYGPKGDALTTPNAEEPLGVVFTTGRVFVDPGQVVCLGLTDSAPLWRGEAVQLCVGVLEPGSSGKPPQQAEAVTIPTQRIGEYYTLNNVRKERVVRVGVQLVSGGLQLLAVDDSPAESVNDRQSELLANAVQYGGTGRDALEAVIEGVERAGEGWTYGAGSAIGAAPALAAAAAEVAAGGSKPFAVRVWRASHTLKWHSISASYVGYDTEVLHAQIAGLAAQYTGDRDLHSIDFSIAKVQVDDCGRNPVTPVLLHAGVTGTKKMLEVNLRVVPRDGCSITEDGLPAYVSGLRVKSAAIKAAEIHVHLSADFASRAISNLPGGAGEEGGGEEDAGAAAAAAGLLQHGGPAALTPTDLLLTQDTADASPPAAPGAAAAAAAASAIVPALDVRARFCEPAFSGATDFTSFTHPAFKAAVALAGVGGIGGQKDLLKAEAYLEEGHADPLKVVVDVVPAKGGAMKKDDPLLVFCKNLGLSANTIKFATSIALQAFPIELPLPNTKDQFVCLNGTISKVTENVVATWPSLVMSVVASTGDFGSNMKGVSSSATAAASAVARGDLVGVVGNLAQGAGKGVGGILSLGAGAADALGTMANEVGGGGGGGGVMDLISSKTGLGGSGEESYNKKQDTGFFGGGKKVFAGVGSVLKGVVTGVGGLVYDPAKGLMEGGAQGFAKGIATGVTGLVFKPVAGVLKGASKIVTGVAMGVGGATSAINTLNDMRGGGGAALDEHQSPPRVRFPRPLFSPKSPSSAAPAIAAHVAQVYNEDEARVLDAAAQLARGTKKIRVMLKEPLALAVVGQDGTGLLCTTQHLLVASTSAGPAEVGFCTLASLTSIKLAPGEAETLVFQCGSEPPFRARFKSARAAQEVQAEIQSRLH